MRELDALIARHNSRQERADYRAALVCSLIANVNRDPKRQPRAFEPSDFMATRSIRNAEPIEEPEGEALDVVLAWANAMGATIVVNEASDG